MTKHLALLAFALAFAACTCGPALADDIGLSLGDGISLVLHGKARFTVLLPTGESLETKGDPIMVVNGAEVGHWPSCVVTYILPNGVELTCRARGYNADTSEIEVWLPDHPVVTVITDVNKPEQKISERVLSRFEMAERETRERGTILAWGGGDIAQVGPASLPIDVGFLVEEPEQAAEVPTFVAIGR